MQCELFLPVDCSDVAAVDTTSAGYKEVKDLILGRSLVLSTTNVEESKARTVYCNLLEV